MKDDKFKNITVAYDKVIKSKDFLPVTRALAMDLSESGYMSPGDFLKNLSDSDVNALLKITDNEENPGLEEILLMSEMLANGEGLGYSKNINEMHVRMNTFCGFLAIEGLRRKGMVKVYHENISFGEEYESKIIVERL